MPWPALIRLTLMADDIVEIAERSAEPDDRSVDNSRRGGLDRNARPFRPPQAQEVNVDGS